MTTSRIIPLLGLLLLTACNSAEKAIKDEITKANYCHVASDCVDVGGKCPFDCYIYVNTAEAGRIKTLVENFDSQCTYSCIAIEGVDCIDDRCVVIPETPVAEEAEVLEKPEGNTGAACTSHEDCQTPMDYLVRSICPYSSRCIDNHCAVVCPMFDRTVDPQTGYTQGVACEEDTDCVCDEYAAGDRGHCACVDRKCVAVVKQ